LTNNSPYDNLKSELGGLADSWERQSIEVRKLAEESTDPIEAARRIGRCDTFDDVSAQLRNRLTRLSKDENFRVDYYALTNQWLILAEWLQKEADKEDNRLTKNYREGMAKAYEEAVDKTRHALENAGIPR
jgi:hypothetical protein